MNRSARVRRVSTLRRESPAPRIASGSVEELLGLREAPAVQLQAAEDRTHGAYRQLLADHLEDERPERVHLRQLLEPLLRVEVGVLVDHLPEHRIGFPKMSARFGVTIRH